jgi:hypothetical protein
LSAHDARGFSRAFDTLDSKNDVQLIEDTELTLGRLRAQAAVVRTLMDHIARFVHTVDEGGLRQQINEEVDRLGRFDDEASVESAFAKARSAYLRHVASATGSSPVAVTR